MRPTAFALALAALAAPALADGAYRFEITPQIQYRFGGTLSGEDNAIADVDLDVNDGEGYGVTFDIPLSRSMQLELLASRQSTELRFDEGLFGGNFDVADIDLSYYHAGILFQGGDQRVNPFFVASAGATVLSPDVPGADTETRFSVSIGGGVKVFFNEHVGMRFEGRGFWTAVDSSDDYCDYYSCWDDYNDNDLTQGVASAGLIFAW
jgi:hypothetical protein